MPRRVVSNTRAEAASNANEHWIGLVRPKLARGAVGGNAPVKGRQSGEERAEYKILVSV